MGSLSGLEDINHSKTEEIPKISEKRGSVYTFKVMSLIFSGLTGLFAFGIFGQFWSLADPDYEALLFQINVIGFICAGFAVISIAIYFILRKDMYVFIICTFLTSIFGSFQFIVFAISPFGVTDKINDGLLTHYQFTISFVLSLITLILVFLYIFSSRKKK